MTIAGSGTCNKKRKRALRCGMKFNAELLCTYEIRCNFFCLQI
jgi:hypothetical protein